jgi:lipopolysaccharide biosynthesis regulator YciM
LLVEGEWRLATRDDAKVRSVWERIERLHPNGLALVLDKWLSALPVEQWPTVLPVVRRWFQRFPQIDAWARYVDVELQCGSADEAFRRLQEAMRVSPDLMVLDAYLRLVVWMVPEGWRVEVDRVRSLVHGYVERLARYHCQKCGFKAKQHHWRCPACGEWGTFPPRRTVAFEGSRAQ